MAVHVPMICRLEKDFSSIDRLFAFVEAFVESEGIDSETAFQLTLATEELFTNLVKYSKQSATAVEIQLYHENGWIELRLTDYDSLPFDITTAQLTDLDVPIEQRRTGGMGLHLVRSFADELLYRHDSGNSVITFRKNIGLKNVQGSH